MSSAARATGAGYIGKLKGVGKVWQPILEPGQGTNGSVDRLQGTILGEL